MDIQSFKCVMIIDEHLPLGLISNTAAVLGATLGKLFPEAVGDDVYDQSGRRHTGIVNIPLPILKGNQGLIQELRNRLYGEEYEGLTVVDFSDVAQRCKVYEDYTRYLAETPVSELNYFGLAVCGDKKQVNKLTGSLPLLR